MTKPKGSGAETPTSEPGYCATDSLWDADWDDAEELFMYRHQRRLSDPSANLNNFVRGGWRTKPDTAATKARSENEGLDSMANGLSEIEAGDVRDGNYLPLILPCLLVEFDEIGTQDANERRHSLSLSLTRSLFFLLPATFRIDRACCCVTYLCVPHISY